MENNTINSSAQPQVQSTASAPVSNNQGGTKKSSSILTIVFLITTLGFAGAFAWAMFGKDGGQTSADKSDAKCVVTQDQVNKAEEGTVAEIVANYDSEKEVKDLINDLSSYIASEGNIVSPQKQSMTYNSGTIPIKLDDGNYTEANRSFGFTIPSTSMEIANAYSDATLNYLVYKNFSKNTELSTDNVNIFDKDGIRCVFLNNAAPFAMACAKTSWISESNVELAKALKNAYVAAGNQMNAESYINANGNNIMTSPNGKYERIQATVANAGSLIGGAYVLFYREVGTTEWTFVTGGNGIPSCSDFAGAAGEAFAGSGFSCADGSDIKKI